MTRNRVRLVASAVAVAVLLAAGAAVAWRLAGGRGIPEAELLGPSPTPTAPPGADITGPLNILIAGHDRVPSVSWRRAPHADAVMILHIDASLTRAYLASLPRDLLVDIPADPASGTTARQGDKLTHAMTYGARVPGTDDPDLAQGFALLARTVSGYTGIEQFDAGAALSFAGMERLVDAIGGVDLYVDTPVTSIHRRPDGTDAEGKRGGEWQHYPVGMFHFQGWQAIDYARQRYNLPGGAYARERHHRQLVRAIMEKIASFDLIRHPLTAPFLVAAIGETVTLDLRGRELHEYAYALRDLRPEALTLVGLPGQGVYGGGGYLGEALHPIAGEYFAALRSGTVAEFLAAHPELVESGTPAAVP